MKAKALTQAARKLEAKQIRKSGQPLQTRVERGVHAASSRPGPATLKCDPNNDFIQRMPDHLLVLEIARKALAEIQPGKPTPIPHELIALVQEAESRGIKL